MEERRERVIRLSSDIVTDVVDGYLSLYVGGLFSLRWNSISLAFAERITQDSIIIHIGCCEGITLGWITVISGVAK